MTIDGRTLLEVAAVLSLLLGALVLSLEWRLSQPMPGLRLWALAAFAGAAGSGLAVLRGLSANWIPVAVGVPLMLAGRALQFAAIRRFDLRPPSERRLAGLVITMSVLVVVAWLARPDPSASALAAATATLLLSSAAAAATFGGAPPSPARLVMGTGLSGIALVSLWRGLHVLSAGAPAIGVELDEPGAGLRIGAVLVLEVVTNVGMMLLITERMHDWVLQLSRHDHLTGVLARGALISQATHELHRARRLNTHTAAIMVDIDHFKGINDERGHPAGDRVLQQVAQRGRQVLRCTDLFGRYGGDEFVAVLPDTDLLTAASIADRLRVAVSVAGDDRDLPALTVSVGVAAVEAGARGLAELISEADHALYNAKRNGRNRVAVGDDAHGPMNTSLRVLQGRR